MLNLCISGGKIRTKGGTADASTWLTRILVLQLSNQAERAKEAQKAKEAKLTY